MSQPQLPPDRNTPQLARQLGRLAVGMGLGLTAVTLGGLWYVRHYINTQLTPQIQQELTRQLQRPVVLGEVQRATLGGLRLGKSAIPVTTTAQDFFNIEAIEVKLDLWQYLRTGRVGVDISADGVSAFIPQQVEPILPPDQPPPTTIPVQPTVVETPSLVNLQSLQISNGEVVIRGSRWQAGSNQRCADHCPTQFDGSSTADHNPRCDRQVWTGRHAEHCGGICLDQCQR